MQKENEMNEIKFPVESKKFALNKNDVIKILKGAGIAALGAGATYLFANVAQMDFGQYTPFVAAMAAIILNLLRKWISGPSQ
jgi:hypothetical protein